MTVIAVLWFGLFPLLCDFTYSHITRSKWVTALILGGVTLLASLILLLIRHMDTDWKNPSRLLCLGFFAWTALSSAFGSMASHADANGQLTVWIGSGRYEGLSTQLCYLAIFLGLSLQCARPRPVLTAAACCLTVFAVIVGLQYGDLNPLGLFPKGTSIRTNYEFQGTIGNIDMVCGYLAIVLPLLLGGFIFGGRSRASLLLLPAAAAGLLVMLLSDVQSGLIAVMGLAGLILALGLSSPARRSRCLTALALIAAALSVKLLTGLPWLDGVDHVTFPYQPSLLRLAPMAAAAVLLLLAWLTRKHPGPAVPFWLVVLLGCSAVAAVLIVIARIPMAQNGGGLYELHELLNGRPQDAYGSWRIGVWRHTLEMVREHPLFGTGPDTFYPAIRTHLAQEAATLGENFDNPHNMFLAICSNSGVPALLLFVSTLAACLVRCVRRHDGFGTAMAWAILCYAVMGFFTFSICIVTPMFWALLGMAAAPVYETANV